MKQVKKPSNRKPVRQVFSQFCLGHGVPKQTNNTAFEKRLNIKFKDMAKRYLDYAHAKAEDASAVEAPYSVIYSSLEFSNALAGQLDAERLGVFAEWLLGQVGDLSGKVVVDIGCGNGLLACFLAKQFPDAQVIALDINMDATLVTDARAIGLKLDNVHTFTGSLDSFLKAGLGKADLVIASQVYAASMTMDVFSKGLMTPDERDQPQQPLADMQLVNELLADDGVFYSQDSWGYGETFCRWVRICEASGLRFLAHRSKGLTYTDGNGLPQTHPVAVFMKNPTDLPPARREDIIAAYGRSKLEIVRIEGNESLADMVFSAWDKTDVYVGKAVLEKYDVTFITRVGVAGGIGYYYACNDAGWQLLHYGPSVRLNELLDAVKEARTQYAHDGATVSWEVFHPEICASLGLDFEAED